MGAVGVIILRRRFCRDAKSVQDDVTGFGTARLGIFIALSLFHHTILIWTCQELS
jgi:hypothetical protein